MDDTMTGSEIGTQSVDKTGEAGEPVAWISKYALRSFREEDLGSYMARGRGSKNTTDVPLYTRPAASGDGGGEVERLTRERDELRAAIFGGSHYDQRLRNGNFAEMARSTEAGRLGAIDRAWTAEASLASMTAERDRLAAVVHEARGSWWANRSSNEHLERIWLRLRKASDDLASPQAAPSPKADRATIAQGLLSDEDAQAAKLGRFGHHPDASCDFCIEVESLQARFQNVVHGISKPGETVEPLQSVREGIARAMTFTVGGDPIAVSAKNELRKLEKQAGDRAALASPQADAGERG